MPALLTAGRASARFARRGHCLLSLLLLGAHRHPDMLGALYDYEPTTMYHDVL